MALRGRCPGYSTALISWRVGYIEGMSMIHVWSFVHQLLRVLPQLVNTTRHPQSAGVVQDG
jgi:hypothetical protein